MPRMGAVCVDEQRLISRLDDLRKAIISWAKARGTWHDAMFHVPFA